MIGALTRGLRVTADLLEAEAAARIIRRRPAGTVSLAQELAFVKRFSYGHIQPAPNQIDSEIIRLMQLVRDLEPSTAMEIGRAGGGSLYLLSRACPSDAMIISLDLGRGPRAHARFFSSFARGAQRIRVLTGNSHDPAIVRRVQAALAGRSLDFLFIDGDHSYSGASADFAAYSLMVRPGGKIALHDIVPGAEDGVGGVPELWQQVKADYECDEIVEDWAQGGFGIGVVTVPPH